ncbi:hypothetical protein R3W88_000766 [Solanum pinnatisectum]|uniref:Uncharacterized protein n=1 Tax=Solanum pinnatisectum TaxID=50273 RepID=A0AAV9MIZ0_9SOLN|nr:hypothetical protein R3W88_000766 [Solanum pinnatisectum]
MAKFLEMGKERYFGCKAVLRGKTLDPKVRSLSTVQKVLRLLQFRGWADLFLDNSLEVLENEIFEFYVNLTILEDSVATSYVNGWKLCLILFVWWTSFMFQLLGWLSMGTMHEASFGDMGIANAFEKEKPIDCPSLMIKHMARVADPQPGPHQFVFCNLLTIVFKDFELPFEGGRALNKKNIITGSTLANCSCFPIDN